MNSPMSLAFIPNFYKAPATAAKTRFNRNACTLRGRWLQTSPSTVGCGRVKYQVTTAVAMLKKEESSDGVGGEEEVLDEAAMRAAEIHEVMTGLQEFKMRIIDDATKLAKKVRAPKKQLETALESHPDILKIDGHIAELEEELRRLGDR